MERSRNLDILLRRQREKRERDEGREIVPTGLAQAVESTRAEIERVLATPSRQKVKFKNSQNS